MQDPTRRPTKPFLIACICFLLAAASAGAAEEKAMTPLSGAGIPMIEGIKMLEPGADAPDFTIKDTDGAPFSLSASRGKKLVLLVFWSIFCEPCRFEMPVIQKLYDRHRESGLDVLAIALDGEPLKSSIVGFIKQEGYSFKVLIDELDAKEMFKVADPYGVAGTPVIFLIDKAGRISFAKAGRVKEEDLEKAVQAVLKR